MWNENESLGHARERFLVPYILAKNKANEKFLFSRYDLNFFLNYHGMHHKHYQYVS
jgi:hypothetical protein